MTPSWPCVAPRGAGCVLSLAVSPQAKRTGADGLHDGALRLRLLAPPVDGKANDALLAWLAGELRVPRRAVRLLQGATSRRKQVEIDLDVAQVSAWLDQILTGLPPATDRPR